MYLAVSERVLMSANLVADGTQPAEVLAAMIKKALAD